MRYQFSHRVREPNPYRRSQTEMRYTFAGQFVDGRVVVDVACGTGIGTHLMCCSGAKTCIGLDRDLTKLHYAVSMYSDCSFACCDAMRLCLPDGFADVVVSCEAIEHFADPAEFVAECARVLRPGGLMICSTPNHTVYRWGGRNPLHLREMNVKEFSGLFKDLFTDVQLYGQWQIVYPTYVLKRILLDFLQSLRVKSLLKRAIRLAADRTCTDTAFAEGAWHPEFEVKPYAASPFVKPMYQVAAARKPLRVGVRQAAKT
jgi:ubiquinone/menaquinone biosynthesis C-methylase UbiE